MDTPKLWIFLFISQIFGFGSTANSSQSSPMDAKALVKSRVSCYICNSDNENQSECAESDIEKLKPFINVCPPLTVGPLAGKEAYACRKVLQNIGDDENVVRECAYTGESVDGKKRTGNKGISLYIYQCESTQLDQPCNSANGLNMMAMLAISILIVFHFFRY